MITLWPFWDFLIYWIKISAQIMRKNAYWTLFREEICVVIRVVIVVINMLIQPEKGRLLRHNIGNICWFFWFWNNDKNSNVWLCRSLEPALIQAFRRKKGTDLSVPFAALPGFEPGNDGVRVRCLTVWR